MEESYRNKIYKLLEDSIQDTARMTAQDFADLEMKLIELKHYEEDVLIHLQTVYSKKKVEIKTIGQMKDPKFSNPSVEAIAEATDEYAAVKKQENVVSRLKEQIHNSHSQTFIRR